MVNSELSMMNKTRIPASSKQWLLNCAFASLREIFFARTRSPKLSGREGARAQFGILKCLAFFTCLACSITVSAQQLHIKESYANMLLKLTKPLLPLQIADSTAADCGALQCARCNVLHTRAAEAMYPFYVSWTITHNDSFLLAAKRAANWLIRQQQPNGSWKETPEEWTGTTTDQLLMLLLTWEGMKAKLSVTEQQQWTSSMQKAADYLYSVMSPEFASINYVATTTATLAKAGKVLGVPRYTEKARSLAQRVKAKFDTDGFLNGEGGKSHGNKMGVDLGYNMEMSLWGLGLYAKISGDTAMNAAVKKALRTHVYFIYPDGSLDASWGIRSNKWTGYGSGTSDGCQVLFSLYADTDPVYANASLRNLAFIEKSITRSGLLGYGPMHDQVFTDAACIYPTFTKAKNLSMAWAFETKATRAVTAIPADQKNWLKLFPTIDVALVRTGNLMATITGYRYKDQLAGSKGKYMFRPTGGAMSHVWLQDWGFLQASSPTIYTRPEPMSFPEAPGILPLTPRIEYRDTAGYFTNLFEFDAHFNVAKQNNVYSLQASGELKDKDWLTGGVGYDLGYRFTDSGYEKTVTLHYHDAWPAVNVIEPFIDEAGTVFEQVNPSTILISKGNKKVRFELLSGNAELKLGENPEKYWAPYPAMKAMPIIIHIPQKKERYLATIRYRVVTG
jgi:hypothetical protein